MVNAHGLLPDTAAARRQHPHESATAQGASLAEAEADALIRSEFAALRGPYLDVAARAPLPLSAQRAAADILQAQAEGVVPKAEWLQLVDRVRAKAAALIGVQPHEIAFTKNASEGLNIAGAGLRLRPGDRIVVAPAAEHPNNVFPWLWQAREQGAVVVAVVPAPGEGLWCKLSLELSRGTRPLHSSTPPTRHSKFRAWFYP